MTTLFNTHIKNIGSIESPIGYLFLQSELGLEPHDDLTIGDVEEPHRTIDEVETDRNDGIDPSCEASGEDDLEYSSVFHISGNVNV